MVKRITEITPEQRKELEVYAQMWMERSRRTGSLSSEEWEHWEKSAKACYGFAEIAWPDNVVHVPSPIVGTFAAPIAAYLIAELSAKPSASLPSMNATELINTLVTKALQDVISSKARLNILNEIQTAVRQAVHTAKGVDLDSIKVSVKDNKNPLIEAVRRLWYYRLGGQHWANWPAYLCAYRDVLHLELENDLWDRVTAYEGTTLASWWWPFHDFVVVSDRPQSLTLEMNEGTSQLHNADGPSISWSDGWALYYWHGVRVPEKVITTAPWSLTKILKDLDNTEVRRAAIEIAGWDNIEAELGTPVAVSQDPGNPGQELKLYNVPEQIFEQPVRVVLMTNASPDKDGVRRRYGETVPADITDPIDAQAWCWGVDRHVYESLIRAT